MLKKLLLASLISTSLLSSVSALADDKPILNASYDIARELFAEINPKFLAKWKAETGKELKIDQSFAGSSRQAQDIIQGKKVDTVTFNQVTDVDILAKRGLVRKDWAQQFPNNSSPYYSTTAFLVRKGNPKNIKNWDDLARSDVKLVFPNPKTSGNARYSYLGAWLYANEKFAGDEAKIKSFVGKILHNVQNFPTGGRAATIAFAQNGQGDVLLTFESEVVNIANGEEFKSGEYEIVVPPVSVLAEFPVAIVDKVVDSKGTRDVAKAYLDFQYSKDIQQLLTTYNYRVHNPEVVKATADQFPQVRLINPTEVLGSWDDITAKHFDANGVLDQLLAEGR
ncbi:thiosulfate/sulfate ABC transporter periplasmic binding protein CysP [Pseudomonas marincola]|jgi:sulfate transport system substrate-binding protein|uniref:Thiosulfate transporter subunit periplasmic-binding component of ABC superfamily n=1 Tax=Pseudomonas marincola TaxID=437900 RepID=A0A653DYK2_9PSED|nr:MULTISPECIES: thiosulfate ABC transporter substrate-binding protein CysP [Pseudomonas]OEO26844.1 thiosulfate transporter subunit [Pseudomonas sp. J237]CAE6936898.1 thiosulfate/sulfate ABC transporter periplasmic binding protein CysP [Pseudomonas marincola]HCP53513.1 sulfate ABC transporter substrate-binding protein [Pseudomonas sp.]